MLFSSAKLDLIYFFVLFYNVENCGSFFKNKNVKNNLNILMWIISFNIKDSTLLVSIRKGPTRQPLS
jgi:hypothetical protein